MKDAAGVVLFLRYTVGSIFYPTSITFILNMGFGIALLVSPYLALLGSACLYHAQSNQQDEGLHVYLKPRTIAPLGKTVLHNVRVFTGAEMSPPQTVVIDGERIAESTDTEDADNTIDASGFLIPGLIDSHLHLNSVADLVS